MLNAALTTQSQAAGRATVGSSGALINGRFLTRPATGVDRFAFEVTRHLQGLPNLAGGIQIALPATAQLAGSASEVKGEIQRYGRTSGHIWEQVELQIHVKDRLLMSFCNTGPMFREKQLIVIHDAAIMATPDNYGRAFRLWYRTMVGNLMRHSRVVCTVSKFSADELVKYFGRPRRGIEVVQESGEHILRRPADNRILTRLGLESKRYVLAVGSSAKNKNLKATQAAMTMLDRKGLSLVAVGGSNRRVFFGSHHEGTSDCTGYLTDAELRALYQSAFCFVFPSLYEGFGLPPIEAMACGCPVIVSNRASLPEVCAMGALYCDPDDPASIAARIQGLLDSADLRDEMAAKGHERALNFKWNTTALQVAALAEHADG